MAINFLKSISFWQAGLDFFAVSASDFQRENALFIFSCFVRVNEYEPYTPLQYIKLTDPVIERLKPSVR
jgi:hypothetical protein